MPDELRAVPSAELGGAPDASSPAAPARGGRARALLAALAVGAVVLAGAGAGGFATARAVSPAEGPVSCTEDDFFHCVPDLSPWAVRDALRDQGFGCARGNVTDWQVCELRVGGTLYHARITKFVDVDLVHAFTVEVSGRFTPRGEAFLEWFAVLPFGEDPEAEAGARQWLADHLGQGDRTATIRGYEYRLEQPAEGPVRLQIIGVSDLGGGVV